MGLSATSQNTFENLARAIGLPELLQDQRFKDNASRLENNADLNQVLQGWLGERSSQEIMDQLVPAGGVVGPVFDASQIMDDPHYRERDDIVEIDDPELGPTKMLGVVPKFSRSPGAVHHAGPTLGQHNAEVYGKWLGLGADRLVELETNGVI